MNHPSEWTRYYDAPKGYYRYKHKGTGVVRDSLMAIGKRFKKQATRQSLKKAVNEASKQMLKKAADKATEKAAEKGADKIQAVLRSGVSATQLLPTPQGKKTPQRGKKTALSTESRQKLKKMLTSGVPATQLLSGTSKLSGDSRKKVATDFKTRSGCKVESKPIFG